MQVPPFKSYYSMRNYVAVVNEQTEYNSIALFLLDHLVMSHRKPTEIMQPNTKNIAFKIDFLSGRAVFIEG